MIRQSDCGCEKRGLDPRKIDYDKIPLAAPLMHDLLDRRGGDVGLDRQPRHQCCTFVPLGEPALGVGVDHADAVIAMEKFGGQEEGRSCFACATLCIRKGDHCHRVFLFREAGAGIAHAEAQDIVHLEI